MSIRDTRRVSAKASAKAVKINAASKAKVATGVTKNNKKKENLERARELKISREENQRFKFGHIKSFLIKEHATKVSSVLEVKKGKEDLKKIKNIKKIVRDLKYKLPEFGKVAVAEIGVNKQNKYAVGVVDKYDYYGSDTLFYLKARFGSIKATDGKEYGVMYEWRLKKDSNKKETNKNVFEVLVTGSLGPNEEITAEELNKIIGYEIYDENWKELETDYIPAEVLENDNNGNSEVFRKDELFDLERQLLMELPRDLNSSRKKILYKTRLGKKSKKELEVEMTYDGIVVFEDGNAIYTSPIDLWNPQLSVKTIYETIEWLYTYILKISFASRDSLDSGTNKTPDEIQNMDQAPNSYLEDKLEAWSETLSIFFTKVLDTDVEVEFKKAQNMEVPSQVLAQKKPDVKEEKNI